MDHLTEQDAGLLEQAATMLEEHSEEQRTRGNDSAAEGAACSAHAIRRLAPAMLRAGAAPAAVAGPALEAPAGPEAAPWCPDACPFTGRPFFMWITHHETGVKVPTYGGPFDSYTLPVKGSDGSFECERYDHDRGDWLTDEIQDVGLKLVDDQSFVVAPDHPRYNEVEEFADGAATFAAAKPGSMITVPFDLIASACGAIDKQRAAPKTLAQLRRYTTGDLSRAALAAAPQAPAAPAYRQILRVDTTVDLEDDPVEGLDYIMSVYERSMGKPAPDAEMGEVVELTKEHLLTWWAAHREDIRAALVAAQDEAAPAAPSYPPAFGPNDWVMSVAGTVVKLSEWEPGAVRARTIYGEAAPAAPAACSHRIADARNPVVKSGYLCIDCGALFSAADHGLAAPAAPAVDVRVAIEKLPRYSYGYKSDEWGMNSHLTSYKAEDGKFLRRDDVLSAITAQAKEGGEA